MKFRNLPLDIETKWNPTYEMLTTALKQRRVIYLYFQQVAHNKIYPPTDNVWGEVQFYKDFSKIFDTSTKILYYLYVYFNSCFTSINSNNVGL